MANHFIKVKSLINSPSRYISNLNILSFNLNAWSLLVSQSVWVCVNFERGRREFCQIQKGYSHQYCLPLVHPCFSSCFCANVKPCEDLHEVSLLNDTIIRAIINQLQYILSHTIDPHVHMKGYRGMYREFLLKGYFQGDVGTFGDTLSFRRRNWIFQFQSFSWRHVSLQEVNENLDGKNKKIDLKQPVGIDVIL